MAAEPETNPPPSEPPITTAPAAASETEAATTTAAITTAQPNAENAGAPPLVKKRHRRPSVRLGEIGDQRAAESHTLRPNMPPWSWRTPKEPSRTAKNRSLTNLANGGADSHGVQDFEERNDRCGDGIAEFGSRRAKAKRGSTTKRIRSNWAPRTTDDDGDEGFRGLDHSPVHSVHDVGVDYWHIGRHDHDHDHRVRVSENDVVESDSRERRRSEGVRSWLVELGLSRYAPMFEIHEVDDELLPMLTLEDLKDMGINAVGSRRKMYTAIQKLRKGFP